MTVAAGAAKAGPYTGNDVTSAFAFSFKVFADADIRVVETLISTSVETDLVLNTNYTVSRNVDQDNNPGGTVTYKVGGVTTALPSTKKLTIVGDFDYYQPTDIPNGGAFFATVVETAFDRVTMLVKQLKEKMDRAVTVDVSSTTDPTALLDEITTNVAAAAASAAAAAASYDSFDDRYLGVKAAAPTLDNDGNALVMGALYFDSVLGAMRVYTGTVWISGGVQTVAEAIHAATNDTGPLDADEFGFWDSVGLGLLKITWANIKASLKTYFDTLYMALVAPGTSGNVLTSNGSAWTSAAPASSKSVPVGQTVLDGPVDSSGLPAFGGSTGGTTVTMAGTLTATAANGVDANGAVNRVGQITNASWTGLSTDGTMYLYLDIAADGTCTTGSSTLEPIYQHGGAYSTVSGQFTFNWQERVGKVGDGAAANQTYRVFAGEVAVAGGVVTAITWYALKRRYDSGYTSTLPSAGLTSKNHNLGVMPAFGGIVATAKCLTSEGGFAVGDVISLNSVSTYGISPPIVLTRLTVGLIAGNGTPPFVYLNKSTGALFSLTAANWAYRLTVSGEF